ncbi:hypothetical protein PE066_13590 [Ramlibacter tataouinensis]|uniref:hypothetical protein n=1 Tax=Ramlibacter tataouinensis TaxID=94132 RepID=UPI0022F3C99E|nr:hypothetical protein [Ramlibacter tataouinensis]WBY00500.1 hypothetical protein PE066_13590 [Ramlibacter tataouinensis]
MGAIQAALALSMAAALAAAQAQPIYRCGDSYSQQPCAGGKALEPESAPTAAERRQAAAATQRDARLADSLERDRVQREAQPASLYIPPPKPEDAPHAHKSPEKKATRKLDVFTASAPASKPPKEKQKKGKGKGKGSAGADQPAQPGSGAGAGTLAVRR